MNKTQIEWVKNPPPPHIKVDANGMWHDPSGKFSSQGYTWNPITGCLNHVDGMCKGGNFPCYAYRLANGRLRTRYLANKNWDTRTPEGYEGYPNLDPSYPRFWPERIEQARDFLFNSQQRRYTNLAGVFVCDMSDLFGIGVPEEWTNEVLGVIADAQYHSSHRFYLLTKQPQNLAKFSPFPDNCWVGVTITGGGFAIPNFITVNAEAGDFYNFKAKVKFISFEPLLYEPTPFALYRLTEAMLLKQVNWVIIGAQTKPYKPPKIEWVREIVDACREASIPYFLKDNLAKLFVAPDGEIPELRQEMPR